MKNLLLLFVVAFATMLLVSSCGGPEKKIADIDSDGIELIIEDAQFNMIDPGSFAMYELEITDTLDNENVFKEFSDVEKVALSTMLNTKFIKVNIKYRHLNENNGTSISNVTGIVSANNLGAVMHGNDNKTVRYMITGTTEKPKVNKDKQASNNHSGSANVQMNMSSNDDGSIDVEMDMDVPMDEYMGE